MSKTFCHNLCKGNQILPSFFFSKVSTLLSWSCLIWHNTVVPGILKILIGAQVRVQECRFLNQKGNLPKLIKRVKIRLAPDTRTRSHTYTYRRVRVRVFDKILSKKRVTRLHTFVHGRVSKTCVFSQFSHIFGPFFLKKFRNYQRFSILECFWWP